MSEVSSSAVELALFWIGIVGGSSAREAFSSLRVVPVLVRLKNCPNFSKILESGAFDLGIIEVETFKGLEDRAPYDQPGEPLMVCRHYVPGGILGGGGADHIVIGSQVFVPQLALNNVAHGELPLLGGVIKAGEKPPALLILGDVEEELERDDTVTGEMQFEGANVFEALIPYILADD